MALSTADYAAQGAPRRLLRNEAYETIKEMIITGDFEPGVFLSERQLTARLNMSKTPIRTALERLDTEGFVAISPQQGVMVRELSFHEIADLFETRLVLEAYVAEAISGRLTKEQRESIEQILTRQQELAEQDAIEESAAVDLQFHLTLTKCLGNQEILRVMNQLRDKLTLVFTRHLQRNQGRLESNYEEHHAIADAVFEGKSAEAARIMRQHLEYGRDYMLSSGRGSKHSGSGPNGSTPGG